MHIIANILPALVWLHPPDTRGRWLRRRPPLHYRATPMAPSAINVKDDMIRQCLLYVSILPREDIDVSPFNRTSVAVLHNSTFVLKTFTTRTTAKVFKVWMFELMSFHITWGTETHLTVTANIRLHTFMTKYMYLKDTTVAEFLLTNVTCQPSTFIVWLQQMCLELSVTCKTVWTVSAWVRLCTSVSINIKLQSCSGVSVKS